MDSTETQFVSFPKMPRLHREIVITEKLDGTNAQIYLTFDDPPKGTPVVAVVLTEVGPMSIYAGSRNRWITPEDDNFGFARWVADNAVQLAELGPGRHFGEWWGKGIQRGYGLSERRFSLFNATRWSTPPACCHVVPTLYTGAFNLDEIENVAAHLRRNGSEAAPGYDKPEGIVVFHTAANVAFKQTLEDDDVPKSKGQKTEPFNG
jgi:hypothetical protein